MFTNVFILGHGYTSICSHFVVPVVFFCRFTLSLSHTQTQDLFVFYPPSTCALCVMWFYIVLWFVNAASEEISALLVSPC